MSRSDLAAKARTLVHKLLQHPLPDMALWPFPGVLLQQGLAPGSSRPFTSLSRLEWAQQRAERASSAAFASTSGAAHTGRAPAKQTAEEQAATGRRRAESRKAAGLRSVAGIGPRNEQRLLSKGISSVDLLAEVFNDHKKRDEDKMVSFLQVRPSALSLLQPTSCSLAFRMPVESTKAC